MRRGRLLAVGLLGLASWLALPVAHAATTNQRADLTGPEETSPPGPADAKGTALCRPTRTLLRLYPPPSPNATRATAGDAGRIRPPG